MFEDKDAMSHLGVVAGAFDDSHQGILCTVAIHVACTKTIDRVGQSPTTGMTFVSSDVQPVETIAYLAETVGFASSVLISVSTSSICNERL